MIPKINLTEKNKKNLKKGNTFMPFEKDIINSIIECFEFLDSEKDAATVHGSIHNASFPYIDNGSLTEIKRIEIDREKKEVNVECVVPTDNQKNESYVLKISWNNLTKELINKYKNQK